MDYISDYPFVGLIEVIGKDTVYGTPLSDSQPFSGSYSFTKVRIINQYRGNHVGNEIAVIDSKGFECFIRLPKNSLGNRYLVKGFVADINDYIYNLDGIPKRNILVLSLCDTNTLFVDNTEVVGWITKNKWDRWRQWTNFIKSITFGLVKRNGSKKKFKFQRMELSHFIRILNHRVKGH